MSFDDLVDRHIQVFCHLEGLGVVPCIDDGLYEEPVILNFSVNPPVKVTELKYLKYSSRIRVLKYSVYWLEAETLGIFVLED